MDHAVKAKSEAGRYEAAARKALSTPEADCDGYEHCERDCFNKGPCVLDVLAVAAALEATDRAAVERCAKRAFEADERTARAWWLELFKGDKS